MLVSKYRRIFGRLRYRWGSGRRGCHLLRTRRRHSEGEMAMVTLIQRFDHRDARTAERRHDLGVGYARPPGDVDGTALEVIAVGNSADGTVVLEASINARDRAVARRDGGGAIHIATDG